MWIVKLALSRPYTFIVLALLILLMGGLAIVRTPVDIFPNINIPVVSVIWDYAGLSPQEVSQRIAGSYERVLTTTVNDVEHTESQSFRSRSVVKVYFQPGVNIDLAISQITAVSQTMLRNLPPGTNAPLVITYSASSVPVVQLALSSDTATEQAINDQAMVLVRPQLTTLPGVGIPYPYGGKSRQIMVDIDPVKLRSKGLTPIDVVNAVSLQNLIIPGGTAKIGATEYDVNLNGSTETVDELNHLPIKTINGSVIYISDVAHVRDGFTDQTNIVRKDGKRAVLLSVIKTGSTSTLEIVDSIMKKLPNVQALLPKGIKIGALFDQSVFVRAAVHGVVVEALIAACLTALMILLFLADWRATLIIAISIPLSILSSLFILSMLGETINLMTLGGLALAVGILVDDATVTIENIDQHIAMGKPLREAILDGAQQIAVPAFVATLCICIVFVPMFLLTGVARYLFVPLAESVVFAMLASYILSRTLVPTLAMYLLKAHDPEVHHRAPRGFFASLIRFQRAFERSFERAKNSYQRILEMLLHHRFLSISAFLLLSLGSLMLYPILGQDFFPSVDAGQIRLHLRTKTSTRIEETARLADQVETKIRSIIPVADLGGVLDNIGVPASGINTSYSNNGTFGTGDAEILISLKKGHQPTDDYIRKMRLELPRSFPGNAFYFQPADIVSQILNFGLPSPIDVQIIGKDVEKNAVVAAKIQEKLRHIPGMADVHIQQALDAPRLDIAVDRSKATELGLTQRDVANSLLVSLSGSGQTTPAFWLNPKNGVVYNMTTKVPQTQISSIQDIQNFPIRSTIDGTKPSQVLANIAKISRSDGAGTVSHFNVLPVLDVYATPQGRDLGALASDTRKVIAEVEKDLPKGSSIVLRGQVQTMHDSFTGLAWGMIGAIILVYLLIVVNFQSWSDPLIIISALPGALAGAAWMLFLTQTTISVPALMGMVMCIGVATANSILVVSFAKELFDINGDAYRSALEAGTTRMRPVLMTAFAMIIGMVPMALGIGEGGEQNAPLARAVIGGLTLATAATLFFVPVIFCTVRGRKGSRKVAQPSSTASDFSHEFHA
jgi:CzcA family heavy metal efflux pump